MAADKSDQERIESLVVEGKITQEEAARLLAALKDTDIEDDAGVDREVERDSAGGEIPVETMATDNHRRLASGNAAAPAAEPPSNQDVRSFADLPEELRWVRVSVLAGDLDIRMDPSLREPVVEGESAHFEVKKDGDGYVVGPARRDKAPRREGVDGLIDEVGKFVGGIVGRIGGDLDIRIPRGFGVILDSKSGDVDVQGVPFVKGSLLAGDLDLRDVGGIDLSMSAGDVDASLRLSSGKHRITVSAGDVDVRLLEGSSVQVTGGVSMGDVEAESPLTVKRTGMGGSLSGQIGDGSAELELSVSAGDLEVRRG